MLVFGFCRPYMRQRHPIPHCIVFLSFGIRFPFWVGICQLDKCETLVASVVSVHYSCLFYVIYNCKITTVAETSQYGFHRKLTMLQRC